MATSTLPEAEVQESSKSSPKNATQYVYFFGDGKADGNGKMKDELGGKGAGLAEMTNAGLPVPPGFTIQTEACREYMRLGGVSEEVDRQMEEALAHLEKLQGQKLGSGENPLLVSVRSGAKFSMPGMMDTILNLGLNDESVEALARRSNNRRFAADSYRRLIQMFGNVVLEIPKSAFDEVFDAKKKRKKAKLDTDLDGKALKEIIEEYKKVVKKHTKREFPQDPHEQLVMARDAVFRSWQNERAKHYRRINNIDDLLGTAVNVPLQMVEEGLITKEEAIFRVEPNQLYDFLVPRLDEKSGKVEVLATGLPASPGAAVGQIVFTADEAVKKAGHDRKNPVILLRAETTPEDIHGMEVAIGILTSRGGMTSHAAVVTRGMGKCCVAGAGDIHVDEKKREMHVKGQMFKEGDWLSLDGTTGRVIKGKLGTLPPKADDPELLQLMGWAEPFRKLRVRANADIPRDAIQARAFGAEGIGLCSTEHMLFARQRITHLPATIVTDNEKDRRAALKKLLPMQRSDFIGVFRAMDGFPVTIRTLDPPLHEFLPRREELMV